jgi:hypothetical protein
MNSAFQKHDRSASDKIYRRHYYFTTKITNREKPGPLLPSYTTIICMNVGSLLHFTVRECLPRTCRAICTIQSNHPMAMMEGLGVLFFLQLQQSLEDFQHESSKKTMTRRSLSTGTIEEMCSAIDCGRILFSTSRPCVVFVTKLYYYL